MTCYFYSGKEEKKMYSKKLVIYLGHSWKKPNECATVVMFDSLFVSDNPLFLCSPASFDRFVVGAAKRPET